MKALIWKELRENIGWALLAMLALAGAEYYALTHTEYPGQPDYYFNDGMTLCRKPFLMVTMFGSIAVGLLLGFLQLLPELYRDRWAALLHRPLPQGRFYWGKAVAGVLLYLVGAGIPFFIMVWLVATPGHFGVPFLPVMIRPGLADLACGLAYYFAALLVALQSGSVVWRLIPALAAVHLSYVATNESLFRVVVIAAFAMSLALCIAGWGAIHSRETIRRRPRLGQIALLIVTFYGACGLGDVAKSIGGIAGTMGDQKFHRWQVLEDGTPARIDYVNSVRVAATDITGKPFTDPRFKPDRIGNSDLNMNTASNYIGDAHGWKPPRYNASYRQSYGYLYSSSPYTFPRMEQWFYLLQDRIYVGMQPLEKVEFARLGIDGFAAAGARVKGFPEESRNDIIESDALFLAGPDFLRIARLAQRKIETLNLPGEGPIYGMCHAWTRSGARSISFQGVAFGNGMAVYNGRGQKVAMLKYQHDVDRWGQLSLGVLKSMDRFVLRYEPSDWIDGKTQKTMPQYVDVVDAEGRVITAYELPRLPDNTYQPTWSNYIYQRVQSPAFFFGEMLYRRIGAALGSVRLRNALHYQWVETRKTTIEVGRILVLVAAASAIATYFWARRAQVPARRAWLWASAVLILGLPGLVAFWVAGERPRTVPCAACRQARRIDSHTCPQCGQGWPQHAADDTTIIEDSTGTPLPA